MANLSGSNFTNVSKITTEGNKPNVPLEVSLIISVIINGISCPCTVLLNVLVIMAVKRRSGLQTNTNILLACLAATDALTGLTVQPSFIAWKSCQLLNSTNTKVFKDFHNLSIRFLCLCSALHLMLVTCERLVAIKFTMRYRSIVTKRTIKVAVIAVWAFTSMSEVITVILTILANNMQNLLFSVTLIFCILFIALAYFILYRETRRHRKKIKLHQLPQEEVERFAKESKALKTTVIVVTAVMLSFMPMALTLLINITVLKRTISSEMVLILSPLVRTCAMLNSLLNPLVYCLRQKEMRKSVLTIPCRQDVDPVMN